MAGALLAGAAVGAAFGELLKAVLDVKDKAVMFKDVLEDLKTTLTSIEPTIKEIESFNKVLDRPEEELRQLKELMNKGEKLIRKCSTIHKWNFCKKPCLTGKLLELNKHIDRYFRINVPVQISRDQRESLILLREIHTHFIRQPSPPEWKSLPGLCNAPEVPGAPIGLDLPLGELKAELFKKGPPMVILTAPAGCGKTTLAKVLCQDEDVKEKFKKIFYITVSEKWNLQVIVKKLFQHENHQLPEFQNNEDAVNQLEQLLKRMGSVPILMVLDDVWAGSESLLDLLKFQIPDYKILVTTRFTFAGFGSTFTLKPLDDEHATALFKQFAFPEGSSYIPDEDTVKKIVKGCKRFPLALKVVGRSLRGKPEEVWQTRAEELSKAGYIFDANDDLRICLQSSLDALNNIATVKDCYMDLGSFPEDQMIPATALIDMWVELYKLDENGVRAIANLHELATRNLVNLMVTRKDTSQVDGRYNEHFVVLHDLLRDLAIHQSNLDPIEQRKRLILEISGNNVPDWWREQKKQRISARLLSISTDEMFTTSWCNMQAPNAEVLVLNFQTKNYAIPEFVEKMERLKALIVTNYGFSASEISNFQLLGSLPNITRIRLEHVSVTSLSLTSLHLKSLRKLSLVRCKTAQAFSNAAFRVSDAFPNLMEIDIDCCDDLVEVPAGLCHLVHLKRLSISNCHKLAALPEGIATLVNLEVLTLSSCINLEDLPESIGGLCKLSLLDISDCLGLTKLPKRIGDLHNLRKLKMRGCSSCKAPDAATIMKLEHLNVICDEETANSWRYFSNVRVEVPQEVINLNWLHHHLF